LRRSRNGAFLFVDDGYGKTYRFLVSELLNEGCARALCPTVHFAIDARTGERVKVFDGHSWFHVYTSMALAEDMERRQQEKRRPLKGRQVTTVKLSSKTQDGEWKYETFASLATGQAADAADGTA